MDTTPPVNEVWKPVVGFEGLYEISDHGRLRSLPRPRCRGQIRRWAINKSGHRGTDLWSDGHGVKRYAHRMVLEAFVGPAPVGMEACHNDGNPANNHVSNLRWDTDASNRQDTVVHGAASGRTKLGSSGFPNVQPNHSRAESWRASVTHLGKRHRLGVFTSRESAFESVQAKRVELGLPPLQLSFDTHPQR